MQLGLKITQVRNESLVGSERSRRSGNGMKGDQSGLRKETITDVGGG